MFIWTLPQIASRTTYFDNLDRKTESESGKSSEELKIIGVNWKTQKTKDASQEKLGVGKSERKPKRRKPQKTENADRYWELRGILRSNAIGNNETQTVKDRKDYDESRSINLHKTWCFGATTVEQRSGNGSHSQECASVFNL